MRDSTRKKLFDTAKRPSDGSARFRVIWETDTDFGPVSLVSIPSTGAMALIHEYREPGDGFEVYLAVQGNSVERCQLALGLQPS